MGQRLYIFFGTDDCKLVFKDCKEYCLIKIGSNLSQCVYIVTHWFNIVLPKNMLNHNISGMELF